MISEPYSWMFLLFIGLFFFKNRNNSLSLSSILTMLLLSCFASLLASYWLYAFWLDGTVIHADFLEYCSGTASPFLLTTGISSKRSMMPMILPRFFYERWGVFDALAIASCISLALTAWFIGLWARVIGGKTAGYVAIATTICLGPLCLMGHIISSYPEMSLCFVIGAMTTSLAIINPSKRSIVIATVGIGLSLLADPRGLLWGLSYSGLLLIRIIFHQNRFSFLVLFGLVLYGSWCIGSHVYVPEAIGFEEQVDFRPMIHRIMGGNSPYSPPFQYDSRWVWGLVPIQEAWKTLSFLYEQSQLVVPEVSVSNEIQIARTLSKEYLILSVGTLFTSLLFLYKEPWKILALGTTTPFLVGLFGSQTMLEHHARFYLNTLPALAMLIAVAWSSIGFTRGKRKALISTIFFWILVTVGIIQSPLSPTAGWQHRFSGSDEQFSQIRDLYHNKEMARKPDLRHCYRALQSLDLDNKPLQVQIFEP